MALACCVCSSINKINDKVIEENEDKHRIKNAFIKEITNNIKEPPLGG